MLAVDGRSKLPRLRTLMAHADPRVRLAAIDAVLAGCGGSVVMMMVNAAEENIHDENVVKDDWPSTENVYLPAGEIENYEGLSPLVRLLLPAAGGLLIGLGGGGAHAWRDEKKGQANNT